MLLLPRPRDHLTAALRSIRPQAGALANAREAVRADQRAARERRDAALQQARALGPRSWTPLGRRATAAERPSGHAVHFPTSEAEQVIRLAAYVLDGLADREACVVLASAEHREGLRQRLALADMSGMIDRGARELLVELDADEVLAEVLVDGWPSPARFDAVIGAAVRAASGRGTALRAYGEVVGLAHGRWDLAVGLQLEQLWDDLQRRLRFPLLCSYPLLGGPDDHGLRSRVCVRHSHLAAALA